MLSSLGRCRCNKEPKAPEARAQAEAERERRRRRFEARHFAAHQYPSDREPVPVEPVPEDAPRAAAHFAAGFAAVAAGLAAALPAEPSPLPRHSAPQARRQPYVPPSRVFSIPAAISYGFLLSHGMIWVLRSADFLRGRSSRCRHAPRPRVYQTGRMCEMR